MPLMTTSPRAAAAAMVIGSVVMGASSCGENDSSGDAFAIEPGACISVLEDEIKPIDCTDGGVDRVLVESLGPAAAAMGTSCPRGTVSMEVRTTFADGTRDMGSTWCVVSPDDVTSAIQARIDDRRASQRAGGD